jgi:hypothetical protein
MRRWHCGLRSAGHGTTAASRSRALRATTMRSTVSTRALALDASNADAWINRANALRLLDRDDAALASYARAMAHCTGHRFPARHVGCTRG